MSFLLDDLANPDPDNLGMSAFALPSPGGGGGDDAPSDTSTFASPSAGGGAAKNTTIAEGDQKTSPDGEPVYFSQGAGRYLTAPAYKAATAITTPKVDPVEHKAAIARLTAIQQAAQASHSYADVENDFQRRNKNTGTGGLLLGLVPHYSDIAQALSLPGSKDLGQMEGDSIATATARTKTISSRPAQMEFLKNLGAVTNVRKGGPSNTPMVDQTNRVNQKAKVFSNFYSDFITQHGGTDRGAMEAWQAFEAQHFDPAGNFTPTPNKGAATTAGGPPVISLNP